MYAASADGFSNEGYTDGGTIEQLLEITNELTGKTKYTAGNGNVYIDKTGDSVLLRLENVTKADGSVFIISCESSISLAVETAGSNTVFIDTPPAVITLTGNGDLNSSKITANKLNKDSFTGKLNARVTIVSGSEGSKRYDYTGTITTNSASESGDRTADNSVVYDNNGFQDLTGSGTDKGVEIDENTTKSFYRPDETSIIYYTPAENGASALLEVHDLSNKNGDTGYDIMYGDIYSTTPMAPLTLKVVGNNEFNVVSSGEITLTGEGSLYGTVMAPGFSVSDGFKGELDLLAAAAIQDGDIPKQALTVYGQYGLDDGIVGCYYSDGEIEGKITLTVPEGSKCVVENTFMISGVGDDYGEYLNIKGEFVNNGTIVCSGNVPSDPAAFIRSLNLSGDGFVEIHHDNGDGTFTPYIYTNDGVKLTYVGGDLDFKNNTSIWGDHMDEYGYSFVEKDGNYVLTLKDFRTLSTVKLPGDKPIIINSSGACYINDLNISIDSDNEPVLTFEGDGELTVNQELYTTYKSTVTVANGAKVIFNNDIDTSKGHIIINGSLTAYYGEYPAVSAAAVTVGETGILSVSGRYGVYIPERDTDSSLEAYGFCIENGGTFIADCEEFNFASPIIGEIDDYSDIIKVPAGYIPHGYEIAIVDSGFDDSSNGDGKAVAILADDGESMGGYIVVHKHSADYNNYIPDPADSEQHIRSCTNDPNHSDKAEKHTFGGWEYANDTGHEGEHKRVCEKCGYTEYKKCSGGEAACTKGKICEVCGGEYTAPSGHNMGEWVQKKAPTDTAVGLEVRTCNVCGFEESREVPMTNPDAPDDSTPTNPTTRPTPTVPTVPTAPTIPDNSTNSTDTTNPVNPTAPDNQVPFIKGENGKDGWEIIKEEIDKSDNGNTVAVDMNGAAVVPENVFDKLKGSDVTVVLDMGDGITWSVNGKDITSDKLSDINFSVKKNTENIPADVIGNITGERQSVQISLVHNGDFGFTAVLSINLGRDNAGQKAALYYYNGGALELMNESEISADGTARLTFTHASDYLIVIGESNINGSDNSDDTSNSESTSSNDDNSGDTPSVESNPSNDGNSGNTPSGESNSGNGGNSETTSSGVSESRNHDTDERDGNPSTGTAASIIPLAAAAVSFIIASAKRRKK